MITISLHWFCGLHPRNAYSKVLFTAPTWYRSLKHMRMHTCFRPIIKSYNIVSILRCVRADDTSAGTKRLYISGLETRANEFATMQSKAVLRFQNSIHVQRALERMLEIIDETKHP